MKGSYRLIVGLLAPALLLVAGLSGASAEEERPYKAAGPEGVVQEGPGGSCGPDRIDVEAAGSGQATHLGAYTIARHHCFNPALATFEDGTFEQTAANGDKVWGTYAGYVAGVLELDEDGNPIVIIINAPWEITGGTGRFAGAQGEGDTYGEFNLVTHSGDFTMDGWIAYAGLMP